MDDRSQEAWLAENVMGWHWNDRTTMWMTPDDNAAISRHWQPLIYLDDARFLDDRLRELGLDRQYADILAWSSDTRSATDLVGVTYATPRQRCEAIRRTWTNHKKGG